jgi:spore germination protein
MPMMSDLMSENIQDRLAAIHEQMTFHSDVLVREFSIGDTGISAAIVFVNGLADCDLIDQHILRALMAVQGEGKSITKSFLINQILTVSQLTEVQNVVEMLPKVLMGATAVLVDGIHEIIIIGTARSKSRNIEEPISEALVRGPRAGFNENLSDNTANLRRHGENDSLAFISMHVGTRAKKQLIIAYIKDIADPELVEEVRLRV